MWTSWVSGLPEGLATQNLHLHGALRIQVESVRQETRQETLIVVPASDELNRQRNKQSTTDSASHLDMDSTSNKLNITSSDEQRQKPPSKAFIKHLFSKRAGGSENLHRVSIAEDSA